MTPDELDQLLTDLAAAAVLIKQARRALEAGNTPYALDFSRCAANLMQSVAQSLVYHPPSVDNSPPIGG